MSMHLFNNRLGRALVVVTVIAVGLILGIDYAYEMREEARRQYIEHISTYFTDSRDGWKYRAVSKRGKVWMAENLHYITENSWCYGDDEANCRKYGRLYAWDAARSACPAGWHLPSIEEWDTLEIAAGGRYKASKRLKAFYGWNEDGNGTDEFGFSALPGGYRYTGGNFSNVGSGGLWWTATEDESGKAYGRYMYYGDDNVGEASGDVGLGLSVRCVGGD